MGRYNGRHYRGYGKLQRELKREEAEARNALTPDDRRSKKTQEEAAVSE